ncbi:MAG: T9SS type A sorting domain-containing protein [Flavihumibacter sp.]|nr:T9SS type A sorting domain-containing protein [Flavihumibacter sp.]
MIRKPLLLLSLLFACLYVSAQLTQQTTTYSGNTIGFYEFKPADFGTKPASYKHPVIISLHGVAERGDGTTGPGGQLIRVLDAGIPLKLNQGATMQFTWEGNQESFIVLAPQMSTTYSIWQEFYVDAMIAYAATINNSGNLKADMNRIFLTGFSLGGGGCWKYATSSAIAAQKIAGIVPAAPSGDGTDFCVIAANKVATWAFHSMDDPTIPVSLTQTAVNSINACTPQVPARATYYTDGSHAIWNSRVYDTSNFWHYPNIYQWMLKVSRSLNPATNLPPVADIVGAPPNYTLTVPVKEIYLDGSASYDPDDIIVNYEWEKVSGPAGFNTNFSTSTRPTTYLRRTDFGVGFDLGTYRIKLKVQDYLTTKRAEIAEEVYITVALPPSGNALPAADAGNDLTLNPSTSSTTIFGNARDWDGWISGNSWTKLSGPNAGTISNGNTNSPSISGLTLPGVYVYEYTVTDNSGGQGKDTVSITKLSFALPLSFEFIKAQNLGNSNLINWTTSQEVNNSYFEVQRAANGNNFTTIGVVTAFNGHKNSYSFTDAAALQGNSYYRLKQVDKDGAFTYSKTVVVKNTNNKLALEYFPNPVTSNLSVLIAAANNGTVQVLITDVQGRVVKQEQWNKQQIQVRKEINVAALKAGNYQLTVQFANGQKQTINFTKI